MRIIAVFEKKEGARFTSHLDMQRAMQRALKRAGVPVRYSSGFNPHMLMSFATALSLGFTSKGEYLDISMEDIDPQAFFDKVAPVMPPSLSLVRAYALEDTAPSLASSLAFAKYEIAIATGGIADLETLRERLKEMLSQPILCMKKGKAGIKEVDVRALIESCEITSATPKKITIALTCACTAAGALNPQLLLPHLCKVLEIDETQAFSDICRLSLLKADGEDVGT